MRCIATLINGKQCTADAIGGSEYCHQHSGLANKGKTQQQMNYGKTHWAALIADKKSSPELKNLSEEIAILRILMESVLSECSTEADLVIKSPIIGDLTQKIEKLVTSCHKLDEQLGNSLDRSQLLSFASKVVDIIGREITDHDQMNRIADLIINELSQED